VSGALHGTRIAVTRRVEQGSPLAERLRALGAAVIEVPAIALLPPEDPMPLDAALRGLDRYAWVVFASANAVRAVAERLATLGLEPTLTRRGPAVAVVGGATARSVREAFPDDEIAMGPMGEARAAGLVAEFARRGVRGQRVLLPQSSRGRDELRLGLEAEGGRVDAIVAYRNVEPAGLQPSVAPAIAQGVDLWLFASPSAVEGVQGAAPRNVKGQRAAVIGPTTLEAARDAGFDIRAVAEEPSEEGLIRAAVKALVRP
jgi:uroporphyrinogen-III synthase